MLYHYSLTPRYSSTLQHRRFRSLPEACRLVALALALLLAEAPSRWVSVEEPSASQLAEALSTWVLALAALEYR